MISYFSKYKPLFITLAILSAIIIFLIYNALKPDPKLPVYQPRQFNPELVDDSQRFVKKYHAISDYELINQNGDTITKTDYIGKIYVADFFFTTCQTICPVMTDHMAQIQEATGPDIMLLSHSVTPEQDTPEVLKQYAVKNGVDDSRWNLVTGDRKQIYDLARKSYFAVKKTPYASDYGMIHTENFTLIDGRGQIRGWYDGTDPEAIDQLLEDIEILRKES